MLGSPLKKRIFPFCLFDLNMHQLVNKINVLHLSDPDILPLVIELFYWISQWCIDKRFLAVIYLLN